MEGRFNGGFFALPVWGAYIWRGYLTEGFSCYQFGGLIFGGAYTWRGLFSEFYGIFSFHSYKVGGHVNHSVKFKGCHF